MRRGRFITLEGGEGAGKTTQARLLAESLRARGTRVLLTREPGGAPGAEKLRALLLSGEVAFTPEAEVLLHFAARAEHIGRAIRPALERGEWVVCDRFADSTMAYQGWGLGADRGMIASLTAMMGLTPDLTLILDVPLEVAANRLKRRRSTADRYESLDETFHRRVAEGFREIAASDPQRYVVIDANSSEDRVHQRILEIVAIHSSLGLEKPPE
jgi:dTMP kinase